MKTITQLSLTVAFVCFCTWTVHAAECGNGIIESDETCDDGNRVPGDCCGPDCIVEEIPQGCETCEDGIDNDNDGRIDAEDSGCATLSEYQRAAIIESKPLELRGTDELPAISGVVLPGALVGEAVDGRCDTAGGTCACPEAAPECQAFGRPCATDGDCSAVPFPLGRSRAGHCGGEDRQEGGESGCRPQAELLAKARAIARIPGAVIEPIEASAGDRPVVVAFEGGRQIIDVADVRVEPEARLVLAGEADTILVLRIHGDLEVGRFAAIDLTGALEANRVLWVLLGAAGRVAIAQGAHFSGTILAPEREAVELGSGARIYGAILAGEVKQVPSDTESPPRRM
jgi:cysteine-rich repeat protein